MKCPHCPDTALLMTDRQGIEIDYCPKCRGVWLDRGELDKLMERAATQAAPAPQAAPQPQPQYQQPHYPQHPQHHQKPYYGKHKKSWLSEIFD